jgi:hypothetical protein
MNLTFDPEHGSDHILDLARVPKHDYDPDQSLAGQWWLSDTHSRTGRFRCPPPRRLQERPNDALARDPPPLPEEHSITKRNSQPTQTTFAPIMWTFALRTWNS